MNNSFKYRSVICALIFPLGCGTSGAQLMLGGEPNPAFSALAGWWDANDEASFTFNAGNEVQSWTDRSAAANIATINGGNTIVREPYLNGTSTVTFTGANFMTLASDVILPVGTDGTSCAFVVAKTADSSGGDTVMSRQGANVQFFRQNNTEVRFYNGQGGGDPLISGDDLVADRIRFASFSGTDAPDVQYFVNGVASTVVNSTNLGGNDFALNRLGGGGGCCGNFGGQIAEVILFNRALSESEQNQVGSYLARKYNISTSYVDPDGEIDAINFTASQEFPVTGGNAIVLGSSIIGTPVGTLTAVDTENVEQLGTFELVEGTGDTNNGDYSIGGNQNRTVLVNSDIAVAVDTVHSIRVRATNDSGSIEEIVTFTVKPDIDTDGLVDEWELSFGTLANFTTGGDFDSDLLFDEDEFLLELDPTDNDEDEDGSLDGQEIINSTDPRDPDTDDDNLNDGDEETAGSNPLVQDTDGDSIFDGDEVFGNNPNSFTSDPTLRDTDGDGFWDKAEIDSGFDPDDPLSSPPTGGSIVENGQLNPDFIFLNAWWDASDESTFTFDVGNQVMTWADKAMEGRIASINGGTSITRDAFLNGTSKVTFTGDNFMTLNESVVLPLGVGGNGSAFVVAKTTDSSGQDTLMSFGGQNRQFFRQNNAEVRFYKGTNPDAIISGDVLTDDRIRFAEFGSINGEGVTAYSVNGVPALISSGGNLGNNDWVLNRIGGGGGCCGNWNGDVAEIIIFDRALTDEEEAQVGGYLASKYGIETSYPEVSREAPVISSIQKLENGGVEFSWNALPGEEFIVELSLDLKSDGWIEIADGYPSGGAVENTVSFTYFGGAGLPDPATANKVFFRVIRE